MTIFDTILRLSEVTPLPENLVPSHTSAVWLNIGLGLSFSLVLALFIMVFAMMMRSGQFFGLIVPALILVLGTAGFATYTLTAGPVILNKIDVNTPAQVKNWAKSEYGLKLSNEDVTNLLDASTRNPENPDATIVSSEKLLTLVLKQVDGGYVLADTNGAMDSGSENSSLPTKKFHR